MHCPEAVQPIVTVLGTILERGGQLNGGPTLLHYRLQSTVYNISSRSHQTFPLTAYFKNGQRWANFPPLNNNSSNFLTGRIFGFTKENRQLAVITDDIHFLPTLSQSLPPIPSPTTGKRKRQDRWAQRANPRSPFSAVALLEDGSTSTIQLSHNSTKITAVNDDDDETQITWPGTPDDSQSLPQSYTPTPERRSQRPRKTSYADIIAHLKCNTSNSLQISIRFCTSSTVLASIMPVVFLVDLSLFNIQVDLRLTNLNLFISTNESQEMDFQ
jgi:hypothetical protein